MEEKNQGKIRLWDELPGYDLIEDVDLPEMHSWFLAATHSVPPWTPLFGWYFIRFCSHGTKAAVEELSIPTSKGWEMRYRDGGLYVAFNIVRDPKEIAERGARFRESLRPWLDNFDGIWEGYKKELLGIYAKLRDLDLENATNLQLYHHNYDMIMACRRMWEIHHIGLYASFSAWLLLEDLCKERFGIKDQDPRFQDMLTGFDNKIYEMDKKMWEFGQLANEMGLGTLFKENKPDSIMKKLQESDQGKDWYKKFIDYLETDEIGGWRMRRMSDFNEPYWLEDPSTPLDLIKMYVMKGTDYQLEEIRKNMERKREAAVSALLQEVPYEERGLFETLIQLAGKASSYSEEHDLYCELMAHAHLRRGYLGIGRRLAGKGTIEKPDDVFMLNPDEIDRVMMVPEAHDLRWITDRRRAAWEEWQTRPNPPLITDRSSFEEAMAKDLLPSKDSIAMKVVVGEMPEQKPELGADIFGICGCAGEVEGTARVLRNYDELKQAQPGDILICPAANPAWTPVFGIVSGVVCDSGGTLSHPAIIGREYNVPTIVNTFNASAQIKTGQRIRLDAARGAVYILDK